MKKQSQKKANNFLPILDNWERHFHNHDEGLGTTYERFLLHNIFSEINDRYEVETILEVPSFGMTGISGINSLWWGQQGKEVFIVDDHFRRLKYIQEIWRSLKLPGHPLLMDYTCLSFKKNSIDLIWNFAALWFVNNLVDFANQIKDIAKKVILISVPNHRSVGLLFRRKFVDGSSGLSLDNIYPNRIKSVFHGHGWRFVKEGIFDIPPWPDIPMKKEEILKKLGLSFLNNFLFNIKNTKDQDAPENVLDYFSGKHPDLDKRILRYGFLENSPKLFQSLWGHHRYLIFEKVRS